eukprot:m.154069 g.154069  ORF g.154069 m.154069 type:complete len:264 (-) comp16951_c0_seq12:291-1082(-)
MPRGTVLVLQHEDECPLGYLEEALRDAQLDVYVHKVKRDSALPAAAADDYVACVSLGGFGCAFLDDQHPELVAEKAFIRDWVVVRRKPFLGICLGCQLLATALGGVGRLADAPEIGYGITMTATEAGLTDPLVAPLLEQQQQSRDHTAASNSTATLDSNLLLFHSDTFSAPPEDQAVVLARSAGCIQVLRAGPTAIGLQVHPEATPQEVRAWLAHADAATLKKAGLPDDGALLQAESERRAAHSRAVAMRFFRAWIATFVSDS